MPAEVLTTAPWNRECVICAHKWQGDDTDNCPACIERVEAMWERNGAGRKTTKHTPGPWDLGTCVRQVIRARNIMRALLDSDERGHGVNFHEAMNAAEEFCCDIDARYAEAMKEVPDAN